MGRNVKLDWLLDCLSPFPSFLGSKHVRRIEEGARYQCPLGEDEREHGADRDLQERLDDAEQTVVIGNRKQSQKLESRVGVRLHNHGVLTTPNSKLIVP